MENRKISSPAKIRIDALLDAGSFVEIGGAVTARATDFNLQEKCAPSDGVITGYGTIEGGLVYVYSQDAMVLKGSVGEMHARKIAALYDMAMKMGAPVIGFIDCSGIRLQEATDALHALGSMYYKQVMASGVIPQITAVFGNCGGGLAAGTALNDFTFMAQTGKLFVNSPNTIQENRREKCDFSSAEFQSRESGMVDMVGTDGEVIEAIRTLVSVLPANNKDHDSYEAGTDDLNRLCKEIESSLEDPSVLLPMLGDHYLFFETKRNYAKEMVTGFLKLNGMTIGAVANRSAVYNEDGEKIETYDGYLTAEGCRKAAEFVKFCDAFGIPVLTLTNVKGLQASENSEKYLAKAMGALIYEFTDATVPKVNVVTGKAYGSAYVAMNSKSVGADLVYAWPEAEIGMMEADMAVKIMYADADGEELVRQTEAYRNLQSSPVSAAKRGYVDAIIEPKSTRKHLIAAFEMLFTKKEIRPSKKHGAV